MILRVGALARLSAICFAAATPGVALAQTAPGGAPAQAAPTPAPPPPDTVVAKVNGDPIRLSELQGAAATLPAGVRNMPAQVLYPMLLNQLIDQRALVAEARRTGLDKEPAVRRQIELAENTALQRAVLMKDVAPQITEQAVRARYEQDVAGKPAAEEVHAKHILVGSEAEAKDLIAQLDKGADFDTIAKKYSKDPGAGKSGDLGFFKKAEMVPAFADAAFALQPGQITQTPVHTQFGWHVIKVVARRQDKPPSFDQAKDDIRQKMVQQAIEKAVVQARADVTVQKFNLDGSPVPASEPAMPSPGTAAAPASGAAAPASGNPASGNPASGK